MDYDKLVLSGGSTKGLAYVGIIKYLEEKQIILKNIKEFVGCSIGAFSALLMILGYSSSTLIDIFSKYQLESLKNFKLSTFFETYGLDDGSKITKFIKVFIKNKNFDENITLQELYNLTNKNLVTVVTNVNEKKTIFISKDKFPDISVCLAVRMSMNLPFIYNPIEYNNELYVDGGISCNFPVRFYSDTKNVLCICLKEFINSENIQSFDDYIYNILKTSLDTIETIDMKYATDNNYDILLVKVNIPSNFNLGVSNEKKDELYTIGYNSIKEFVENKNK